MINQKYLELINKDIDNEISSDEKKLLDHYLKSHSEANIMHQELGEIENLLDKLPESNPSGDLKVRILNSIDVNRYAYKKKHTIKDYFITQFSGSRRKLTVSFALGLITGLIFLSAVFYAAFNNSVSDTNNVLGTIGLSDSRMIQSIKVNSADIKGEIDVIKAASQYALFVNLQSYGKYTLKVEFDDQRLSVENPAGFKGNDNLPYSLLLPAKGSSSHRLLLSVLRDDNEVFKKLLELKK